MKELHKGGDQTGGYQSRRITRPDGEGVDQRVTKGTREILRYRKNLLSFHSGEEDRLFGLRKVPLRRVHLPWRG